MDELRVPKRRLAVEVVLPGGAAREMTLFLSDAAPSHDGPERPSDLLNGRTDFLPALDGGGATTFLNRMSVAVLRADPAAEPELADEVTIPTEHEVEVLLVDGTRLAGLVSYLRPDPRTRLVDVLNEPPPFLRLLEPGAVALVNKRHVARITLLPR